MELLPVEQREHGIVEEVDILRVYNVVRQMLLVVLLEQPLMVRIVILHIVDLQRSTQLILIV